MQRPPVPRSSTLYRKFRLFHMKTALSLSNHIGIILSLDYFIVSNFVAKIVSYPLWFDAKHSLGVIDNFLWLSMLSVSMKFFKMKPDGEINNYTSTWSKSSSKGVYHLPTFWCFLINSCAFLAKNNVVKIGVLIYSSYWCSCCFYGNYLNFE